MLVLVTGGAASGKSAYAERVTQAFPGPRFYFAAMKPFGAEAARRIERHRVLRAGKGFATVECHAGVSEALAAMPNTPDGPGGTALLECLGNVVANELFADDGTLADPREALDAVLAGADALAAAFDDVVIVGNEVGCDGMRYDGGTQAYIRVLGAASCALAARCDAVVEVVCGRPSFVKGSLAL